MFLQQEARSWSLAAMSLLSFILYAWEQPWLLQTFSRTFSASCHVLRAPYTVSCLISKWPYEVAALLINFTAVEAKAHVGMSPAQWLWLFTCVFKHLVGRTFSSLPFRPPRGIYCQLCTQWMPDYYLWIATSQEEILKTKTKRQAKHVVWCFLPNLLSWGPLQTTPRLRRSGGGSARS